MPSPSDPTRGFFILVLIALAIGGALALFAWRAPTLAGRRGLRAGQPRDHAAAEQCLPGGGLRLRVCRHALSAGAGCHERHQDFRGPALLRADLRADLLRAAAAGAVRAAAGLEARRSESRVARRCIPRWAWPLSRLVAVLAIVSPRSLAATGAFAVAGWLIGASIHRCPQAQGRARQRLRRRAGACRAGRHPAGRRRHHGLAQRGAGGAGAGPDHDGRSLHACASTA